MKNFVNARGIPFQLLGKRGNSVFNYILMNSGKSQETRFRYFMVAVGSLQGGSTIQFSKLRFFNGDIDNCYPWCNDMVTFSDLTTYINGIRASGTRGASGEELWNGLMGIGDDGLEYGKMCYVGYKNSNTINIDGIRHACYAYDVDRQEQGRRIDILSFPKWCWYTSNDTSDAWGDRNMKDFKLYMSNDRKKWMLVDEITDATNVPEDYTLAYTGDVALKIDETTGAYKYIEQEI